MTEPQKRTIGAKKKIGGGGSSAPPAREEPVAAPPAEKPKKGKKVLVTAVAALALVGIGIGASTFLLRPADGAVAAEEAAAEAPPELGPVAPLEEPISVNLSNGGYLRLGLALQLPAEGEEGGHGGEEGAGPDVSRVRDIAIALFSGRDISEVNDPVARESLRAELLHSLRETFGEHEVLDVYFTDFVTQ